MRISEIFHSIQGEGILAGVPSVFIRTSGCNLRCRWCDTPYASWKPEGETQSIAEIATQAVAYPAKHVVLTGGEPMIAKGIESLAEWLRQESRHITIETAGTIPPGHIACDLASLSPKLSHSTPDPDASGWSQRHEERRLRIDVLDEWMSRGEYQLKFVVREKSDLAEIEGLLNLLALTPRSDRVLLMAEGTDPAALREKEPLVAAWCLEQGWRFSPRLHITWWGNRRGI